jgi:hypothetical protein
VPSLPGSPRRLLDEAIAVSRETGLKFFGPRILAELALAAEDPAEQQKALSEDENILGEGCVVAVRPTIIVDRRALAD